MEFQHGVINSPGRMTVGTNALAAANWWVRAGLLREGEMGPAKLNTTPSLQNTSASPQMDSTASRAL